MNTVLLPASVWDAVAAVDQEPGAERLPWQPLILALDWAREHPEKPPSRTGPQLLAAILEEIGRRADARSNEEADPGGLAGQEGLGGYSSGGAGSSTPP